MSILDGAGAPPAAAPSAPQQGGPPLAQGGARPAEPQQGQDLNEQDYEDLSDLADLIVYKGDTAPGSVSSPIASLLRGAGENPVVALGTAAASVTTKATNELRKRKGSPVDPAAAFAVMTEEVQDLADVAAGEGIYDYSEPEIEDAMQLGAQSLFEQNRQNPDFSQAELQMDNRILEQMSNDGSLDSHLMDLATQAGVNPSELTRWGSGRDAA